MQNENQTTKPTPSPGATCYASLSPLPEQPLCKHYTGATLGNLSGDYSCKCLAGVPYERWSPDMDRWPCRRRDLLGLEQHACAAADYSPMDGTAEWLDLQARAAEENGGKLVDLGMACAADACFALANAYRAESAIKFPRHNARGMASGSAAPDSESTNELRR